MPGGPRYTKSELENRFAALVTDAGLAKPRLNTLVDGERREHEVDAYWPEHRLVRSRATVRRLEARLPAQ